jgi:hypothetical protein
MAICQQKSALQGACIDLCQELQTLTEAGKTPACCQVLDQPLMLTESEKRRYADRSYINPLY